MATQNTINTVAVGVHGPVRPWVYKRLVEHDADFVGLIAYGLYKKRKTEIAESHRSNGVNENDIEIKLREYHDQVVVGMNEIERFRADATTLLDSLLENVTTGLREGHSSALKALADGHAKALQTVNVAHEKSLKEAKKQAIDDVSKSAKQAKQNLGTRDRCIAWLMDGVQSTLAGVLVTVLAFGLFTFFSPDNLKIAIATRTVQALTGTEPAKVEKLNSAK